MSQAGSEMLQLAEEEAAFHAKLQSLGFPQANDFFLCCPFDVFNDMLRSVGNIANVAMLYKTAKEYSAY